GARDPVDGIALRYRLRVGGDHGFDAVAAFDEELGQLGRVARRAPDVGRPDPRDDQHLHEAVASCGVCCRWSLAPEKSHAAANTTVEIRTAAAAPVASQIEPSTSVSGTTTRVSTPCVAIRSSGLPTETGSDFVQAKTRPIAPAMSRSLAASD